MLLGASVFLFGFISRNSEEKGGGHRLDWRGWLAIGFLILSVVMVLARTSLIARTGLPAEVSPSARATWNIGLKVFKEGPRSIFFGSGPGTFGIDWGKYKDPSINQTIFWGFRFNQGSSWATTLVPTVGILGFGSFLLFILSGLYIFLKLIFVSRQARDSDRWQNEPLATALLLGYIVLLISAFLHFVSLFAVLVLFMAAGALSSLLSKENSVGEGSSKDIWVVEEKHIKFTTPWAVFLSSLSLIFIIAVAVTALYQEAGKIRAAFAFQAGIGALNRGDIDEAAAKFEKMTVLDDKNFRNSVKIQENSGIRHKSFHAE